MTLIKTTTLCIFQALASVALAADPAQNTVLTLTRTADNAAEVQGTLTKNTYRQEPYQAEYTVQVPYQATETYYEQVPYTERVAYTDYEDYYEQERRCRTETSYERECHSDYVCGFAAAFSAPVEIDLKSIRPDPRPGDGPVVPPACRYVERCENRPVSREVCGYESVRRQRPVTRYRDETRYRQEERTRTVTRYRNETRCCETRYRDVFDHQWSLPVTVRFPAQAVLLAGETETFTVELAGTEAQPDVNVSPKDTIFGYTVKLKDVKPGTALVEFALAPKFSAAQAGVGSVSQPTLEVQAGGKARLSFTDKIRHSRVQTAYRATISDQATQQVLSVVEGAAGAANQVVLTPAESLPSDRPLAIRLEVLRQGLVLENGQVAFEVSAVFSGKLDLAIQRDNGKIGGLDVAGNGLAARMVFFDQAPAHADVKTVYKISTSRKTADGKTVYMQEKSLDRATLTVEADGSYSLSFAELGVSEASLKAYFGAGAKVTLSLEVFRTGSKFSKISLWQGKTVTIR